MRKRNNIIRKLSKSEKWTLEKASSLSELNANNKHICLFQRLSIHNGDVACTVWSTINKLQFKCSRYVVEWRWQPTVWGFPLSQYLVELKWLLTSKIFLSALAKGQSLWPLKGLITYLFYAFQKAAQEWDTRRHRADSSLNNSRKSPSPVSFIPFICRGLNNQFLSGAIRSSYIWSVWLWMLLLSWTSLY